MLLSRKLLEKTNSIFKKISDDDLSKLCNRCGIEVEQIIRHHKMSGLSICYIDAVEKHPNADKLNIAKVHLSKNEIQTVVCGASNIKPNKYAIYAPVGTSFFDGRVIERKNIRGIESCGMLCGFQELTTVGIENMYEEDANGIILLDNAKLGDDDIGKYINNDDVIFDLSIPSNRNDLNSVFNLEQELCFALQVKSLLPNQLINDFKKQNFKLEVDKEICSDICFIYIKEWPRYKATWTDREILMSSGYKIHNNVLDLMNLFTLAFGNPIHVYDAQDIDIDKLSVKLTNKPIVFNALNQKTYEVPSKSIGVYSKNELINVAGIIGDEAHMYKAGGRSIIIEVANFDAKLVRSTAQKMKISTKAQSFFSKPYSGWITQYTFLSIMKWLKERNIKFQYGYSSTPIKQKIISYNESEMLNFIGVDNLKYKANDVLNNNKFYVHPSRLDVENKYDVFEEIMKIIDINTLPIKPIIFDFKYSENNQNFIELNKLRDAFVAYGLIETKTYNLSSEADFNKFNFWNNETKTIVANPISKNREVLRTSLINEMLKVIQYNIARKRQLFNIFEIQVIEDSTNTHINLSSIFCSPLIENKINNSFIPLNIIALKSIIKNSFHIIGIDLTFKITDSHVKELYNNQMTAIYWKNHLVGYIGVIRKSVLKTYDIHDRDIFAMSMNIEEIIKHKNEFKIKAVSDFPTVYRDINVTFSKQYNVNDLIQKIMKIENINNCWVKDIFNTEQNTTTYTLALKISSLKETLHTTQIDNILEKVRNILN